MGWLKRLILTCDKTTVRGDFLIDDKPSICGSQQPLWTQIIFDAPYNRDVGLGCRRRLHLWDDVEAVLFDEFSASMDSETEASEEGSTQSGMHTSGSMTSMTSEDVAQLRDFSQELEGTSYTKDYSNWRKGHAKGAKGDFRQAVAEIEKIRKQMFLEGDDWSSVHTYRREYQNWRKGNCRGAKNFKSDQVVIGVH